MVSVVLCLTGFVVDSCECKVETSNWHVKMKEYCNNKLKLSTGTRQTVTCVIEGHSSPFFSTGDNNTMKAKQLHAAFSSLKAEQRSTMSQSHSLKPLTNTKLSHRWQTGGKTTDTWQQRVSKSNTLSWSGLSSKHKNWKISNVKHIFCTELYI